MMNKKEVSVVLRGHYWIGLLGAVFIYALTQPWGLGELRESVVYLEAAKHFALGQGFQVYGLGATLVPMPLPAGYSFVLSWSWFLGLDVLAWARILQAAFFGGNIILLSAATFELTQQKKLAFIAGSLLFFFWPLLQAHLIASPVPLVLLFSLSALICFLRYQKTDGKIFFYMGLSLAVLTLGLHWAGVFIVLIFCIMWLMHQGRLEFLKGFLRNVNGRLLGTSKTKFCKVLLAAFLLFCLMNALALSYTVFVKGLGYHASAWMRSKAIKELKSLDDGVDVYTDDVVAAYALMGRPAVALGVLFAPSDKEELRKNFESRQALVVLFDQQVQEKMRLYLLKELSLAKVIGDEKASIFVYQK